MQLSEPADIPSDVKLKALYGFSAGDIYFAGDNGIVVHYTPDVAGCEDDSDCAEGSECVEGACEPIVVDNPPALGVRPVSGSRHMAGIADIAGKPHVS